MWDQSLGEGLGRTPPLFQCMPRCRDIRNFQMFAQGFPPDGDALFQHHLRFVQGECIPLEGGRIVSEANEEIIPKLRSVAWGSGCAVVICCWRSVTRWSEISSDSGITTLPVKAVYRMVD